MVRISYSTEARDLEVLVKKAGEADFSIPIHGDPSVSDQQSFEKIVLLCSSKKIPFEAVPGISSVNVAPAREGLDLAGSVFMSLNRSGPIDYSEISRPPLGRAVIVFPEARPPR